MVDNQPVYEVKIQYTKRIVRDSYLASLSKTGLWLMGIFVAMILLGLGCFIWVAIEAHSINKFPFGVIVLPVIVIVSYKKIINRTWASIERFGSSIILNLSEDTVSWVWGNDTCSKVKWSTFLKLKKTRACWLLYVDKNMPLYLPVEQLSEEVQAFILQKLAEHNVLIKH